MPNCLVILTEPGNNNIQKYSTSIPSTICVWADVFVLNVDQVVPVLNLKSSWKNKINRDEPLSGLPWWFSGKESACQCRFHPWVRKIPWRRKPEPTLIFLPGKAIDRGAWWATVHGVTKRVRHDLTTKQQPLSIQSLSFYCKGSQRGAPRGHC